jgi:hypothetical protein
MSDSPIFILGSERSGTNFLRSRLDNHSNIAAPVPTHTLKWFYNIEPFFGDLSNEKNYKKLVTYIIKSVQIHPSPWKINFDYNEFKTKIPNENRSVFKIFEFMYNKYKKAYNKNRWCCKDNYLHRYAWKIRDYFKEAKFIYIVRDPRDVYLSDMKREGGHYTPYTFSQDWKKEQDACIRLYTDSSFKKNILLVRYENLISNPQIYFKKICNFIDEDFESDMIRGKKRSEAKRSKQWENVSKDVMKNNKKKYIAELNKREIKIIEKKCAFEMKFLGYDFEFEKNECYF